MKVLNTQTTEERKGKEEELRQIRLIVENSHDAIVGVTLDSLITSWNKGAMKMFGYDASELLGKPLTSLFPPELQGQLPALLERVKHGEVIADYDTVWLRKDVNHAEVELSLSPVYDEEGVLFGISIVGRDISERRKSERHIKELNETRNKFIAIISHQLRTPLTAINWNLEALLNGDFGKLEETQRNFLHATHQASVEITRRIHDLLTAMDVEEGRVRYESGDVALDSLCAGVVNELLKNCEMKGVSCTYVVPSIDIPIIDADGEKIRMATAALVENAIDYTKEGGKIVVTLGLKDGVARVEVIDHGVGIPQAEQHRIFTRFFRASNASVMKQDAFGLGLFLAKSFIEQHGGKIGFESEEGVGSTFWYELPIKNSFRSV